MDPGGKLTVDVVANLSERFLDLSRARQLRADDHCSCAEIFSDVEGFPSPCYKFERVSQALRILPGKLARLLRQHVSLLVEHAALGVLVKSRPDQFEAVDDRHRRSPGKRLEKAAQVFD